MKKKIKPIHVLVGEANDGHAELVEASLQESGVVNSVSRGRDRTEILALACQAWKGREGATEMPSLILLDCGLPREGGIGVLRSLKRDRRCSWIPVIMMTSSKSRQQSEQFRRLGCEACVTKWAVFLALPDFVRRVRFLADSAVRIASRRKSVGWSHGYCAGTMDRRFIPDATQVYDRE